MLSPYISLARMCMNLPISTSHAESCYMEVDQDQLSFKDIWNVLEEAEGVILEDDPSTQTYPTPLNAENKEAIFVGRVRKDFDVNNGFHLWVVSDNLLNGAAL